jgi:hypothetical protein
MVGGQSGKWSSRAHLQNKPSKKWTEGVTSAVECLLCNHKVLNSDPSPTKKRKKKKDLSTISTSLVQSLP